MNARMRRTTAGPAGVRATARPGSGAPRPRPPAATRVPTGALTVLVRRVEAGTIPEGSTHADPTLAVLAARPGRPARAAADGPRHGAAIRPPAPQQAVPRHAGRRPSPASPRPGRRGPERPGQVATSTGRTVWPPCRVMPEGHRGPEGPAEARESTSLAGPREPRRPGRQETRGDRRACQERRTPRMPASRGGHRAPWVRADPGDRAAGARCAEASGSRSSPPPR